MPPDVLTGYALVMGLLIVFLLVLLVGRQKSGQGVSLWLMSGIVGMLLGSAVSYAAVMTAGFTVIKTTKAPDVPETAGPAPTPNPSVAHTPPPGGGGMGGGGGMPMGGGGGMGGGRGPSPKRDLTTLVRKLNLLTDDISLKLSSEQSAALIKGLSGVDAAEKFSDDDAKKMYEELFAVLTDDQKAKLDAVGLPFGGGGGRGGGGGGGMGVGGGPPDPDLNPFKQENNLKALTSFRGRFDAAQPAAAEATEK